MKKTQVINLLGGPGTGKSTLAAALYADMKLSGYSVEVVNEYAKELVYEDRHSELANQLYVTIGQYKKLSRLFGKVDYIITDSPLSLSKIYAKLYGYNPKIIGDICDIYDDEVINKYYYLERHEEKYQQEGRVQNEEEAIDIDECILNTLTYEMSNATTLSKHCDTNSRVQIIKKGLNV